MMLRELTMMRLVFALSMELARVIATHESAATLIFAAVAGEVSVLHSSGKTRSADLQK